MDVERLIRYGSKQIALMGALAILFLIGYAVLCVASLQPPYLDAVLLWAALAFFAPFTAKKGSMRPDPRRFFPGHSPSEALGYTLLTHFCLCFVGALILLLIGALFG